jgi:hypothetical protein
MATTRLKFALAGLGTIILGALGSGLWANVLGPASGWLLRTLLNVGALGVGAFRDAVYRQIAANNHQDASLLLVAVVVSAATFSAGVYIGVQSASWQLKRVAELGKAAYDPALLRLARSRHTNRVMSAVLLLVSGYLAVSASRVRYVAEAQAYYSQLRAAVRPYVNDSDQAIFDSRFATMRTKADYVTLVASLHGIANDHAVVVPEFSAW